MSSIYPLERQCASCQHVVRVGEDHRLRLPTWEAASGGVDGRPGYDIDWLVYEHDIEHCSQCGHLAPTLSVP